MTGEWGDGIYPVQADQDSSGQLIQIRIILGDEQRRQRTEAFRTLRLTCTLLEPASRAGRVTDLSSLSWIVMALSGREGFLPAVGSRRTPGHRPDMWHLARSGTSRKRHCRPGGGSRTGARPVIAEPDEAPSAAGLQVPCGKIPAHEFGYGPDDVPLAAQGQAPGPNRTVR